MPPGQVSRGQPSRFRSLVRTAWSRAFSFGHGSQPDHRPGPSDSDDDSKSGNSSNDDESSGKSGSGSSNGNSNNNSGSGKSGSNDNSDSDSDSSRHSSGNDSGNNSSGSSGSKTNGSTGSSGSDTSTRDTSNSPTPESQRGSSLPDDTPGVPIPHSPPTSSSPPSGKSSSLPALPCFFNCVPDNDPRVIYSPNWSLHSQGTFQTSHQTDVIGSSLSFTFNGSGITVFGSIPASNAAHRPPTAVYAVDAAEPFTTAEPLAAKPILRQPLFSASHLSNGTHTLVVNVTDVQAASPYSIDFFFVSPMPSSPAPSSSSSLAPSSASSVVAAHASNATVGILAGILGSAVFILLCLTAFLLILRRRRQRARRSKRLQSSLFTSSESILRWNDWGGRAPSAYSSSPPGKPRSLTFSEK